MQNPLNTHQIAALEAQIAAVEAKQASDWRNYQRYETWLIRLKLRLQIALNQGTALAKKRAAQVARAAWQTLQRVTAQFEYFAYIERLKAEAPRAYDWGITKPYPVIER